jgi:heme/copper-type cytochrome/quinol oxidase subunit 1
MGASVIAVAVAFVCFGLSAWFQYSTGKMFLDFERLFWGGGHILQFANTMAMTAVWLYLSRLVFKKEALAPPVSKALYCLFLLFIIPSPLIYFLHDTSTEAYKESFTSLMRWGMGPSVVFILAVGWRFFTARRPWRDPGFSSLVLSVAVFSLGGLIGVSIKGANTIVPAHYHCAIGAVTIAFMGLFYKILPSFGKPLWSARLAAIQPYLYSLGIILFAIGLFLAGSHGVARKAYGGAQNLDTTARFVGMSIMGLGALVAISGGIAFVLNAVFSLFGRAGAAPVRDGGPEVGG